MIAWIMPGSTPMSYRRIGLAWSPCCGRPRNSKSDAGIEQGDCRIGSVFLFVVRNTPFCPIASQTVNYCLILENAGIYNDERRGFCVQCERLG